LSPISRAEKSHAIVTPGLEILVNLDHRGAVGADPLLGDGAGILIQIPDALLRDWAGRKGVDPAGAGRLRRGHVLPAAGREGRAISSIASSRSSSPRKARS
jgi:glutamate synthase domain-containing protein 1